MKSPTQLAYQEAAVRNASAVELVVMLYAILARDLYDAISAMENGQIEERSVRIKHGLLVLQQLEGTLDFEQGGDLTKNMSRFYSMLRSQILRAQIEQDPAILRELIQFVFSVREAWEEISNRPAALSEAAAAQGFPADLGTTHDPDPAQRTSWRA
jgi:flagellar protein FliS